MSEAGKWIVPLRSTPGSRYRLVCVPHAGGGTASFRHFAAALPDDIDVAVALLPGREGRRREPLERRMDRVVEQLHAALDALPPLPTAVLGRCAGAYTAQSLAARLHRTGTPATYLFAVAAPGPATAPRELGVHQRPTPALLAFLRDQGMIPPAIVEDPRVFAVFEPAIRADFEILETSQYRPDDRVGCRVTAIGARGDTSMDIETLFGWQEATDGRFDGHLLPGDHSFFDETLATVVRIVEDALCDTEPITVLA